MPAIVRCGTPNIAAPYSKPSEPASVRQGMKYLARPGGELPTYLLISMSTGTAKRGVNRYCAPLRSANRTGSCEYVTGIGAALADDVVGPGTVEAETLIGGDGESSLSAEGAAHAATRRRLS